jgi:hypothetical protein
VRRHPYLAPAALLLFLSPIAAEEVLTHSDSGALGETITYHLKGEASRIFVLLPSGGTGPTVLPGHTLDIGLDLLHLMVAGYLDAVTGEATVVYNLPPEPALQGMDLYAQYITAGPPTPPVEAVSNRVAITLGLPGTTVNTIGDGLTARQGHTATLLNDGGVLIAGGDEPDPLGNLTAIDTLELYNPQTQEFTLLPATLSHARSTHTATLLADGRVLFLGGYDVTETVRHTGDIYDPVTGLVTATASMVQARTQHTSTLLADGRVLVLGGSALFDLDDVLTSLALSVKSAEIFDPSTGTWGAAPPNLPISEDGIIGHSASRLGNGQVLVCAGVKVNIVIGIPLPSFTGQAWRYDPPTNSWISTASMSIVRAYHGQITLADGTALVLGGADGNFVAQNFWTLSNCQTYDAGTNSWTPRPSLVDARAYPNLVDTGNELVLSGGLSSIDPFTGVGVPEQTIEISPLTLSGWSASGEMLLPREVARAVATDDGERILIVGVGDNGVSAVDLTAETYVIE